MARQQRGRAKRGLKGGTGALLLRLVWPYRGRLALGVAVLLISTAGMMAIPQILKSMFDRALLVGDRGALAEMAGLMMGLSVMLALGVLARGQLIQVTAAQVGLDLRRDLVAHLLRLHVGWFETRLSGELTSRMAADVTVLREFIQLAMPQFVRGLLLTVGAVMALLLTSPALTGVLVVAVVPMLLMGKLLGGRVRELSRAQQASLAEFSGALAEQVAQPGLVRAFRQEPAMQARMDGMLATMLGLTRRQVLAGNVFVSLNVLVGFVALTGVVWLGGVEVIEHRLTLGAMMAFLLYLGLLADGVNNLSNVFPAWAGVVGALDRVREILADVPAIVGPFRPVALPPARGGRRVVLEGVEYAYPARPEALVLEGVDMEIQAGQRMALVGPSGAGKSTIFRLLLRLDDVRGGRITLDGVDVRELALDELRAQFAVVTQDAPLLAGTVRENVVFGKAGAAEADIWAALKVANAADFVRNLPQVLETAVGERGVQLSGGQRQRLAIARAVLVDAPVLLLDEATSHLDTANEKLVQDALNRAGAGRTVVVIAHRLSTVEGADVVYRVEGGRVGQE